MVQSGIENPSKSEVIGRCGGDEKTEWPRRTDSHSLTALYITEDSFKDPIEGIGISWNNCYIERLNVSIQSACE